MIIKLKSIEQIVKENNIQLKDKIESLQESRTFHYYDVDSCENWIEYNKYEAIHLRLDEKGNYKLKQQKLK